MIKITYHIIIILLLLLWIPVTIDKILNFSSFQSGILRQPLSTNVANLAIYTLPVLEVLTIVLLLINRCRQLGFLLSSLLMTIFTFYVGLALIGTWEKLPCGCGSVISGMSWPEHFWFNITFLLISIIGMILSFKFKNDNLPLLSKLHTSKSIH